MHLPGIAGEDGHALGRAVRPRGHAGVRSGPCDSSARCSSPTAGRSRCASCARCASSGSRRSPSTRRPTPTRCTCGWPTRRSASGRARSARATSTPTRSSRRRARRARTRSTPATASSPSTPASRARARRAGLVFIGPPPEAIESMGVKTTARRLMEEAGVPVVPGTMHAARLGRGRARDGRARSAIPVAFKTSGGGGGKGFRVARSEEEGAAAFERAASEGERFFANADVYVEQYLEDPRHVEVQILARRARQRRPSRRARLLDPAAPPEARRGVARRRASRRELRERICAIAVEAARAVGYRGAGTVEGLLVGDQLLLPRDEHAPAGRAPGHRAGDRASTSSASRSASPPASRSRSARRTSSSAATRSSAASTPSRRTSASSRCPGTITRYEEPGGPGVRVDSGVVAGWTVPPFYDSLLAKLIVWDETREAATRADAAGARGVPRSRASRRSSRSTGRCSRARNGRAARRPRTCSTTPPGSPRQLPAD